MSRRRHRPDARDLHGILLLDKPLGMSSNKALQMAIAILHAAKGGHTGALDPLATGLLPLCFGEATKIAGNLLGSRKAYLAECRLGITTTTADLEGEVLDQRPVPSLDETAIEAALATMRGCIVQVPPAYSALKQGGEPLYLKARRGEVVQAPPRQVDIHRLELVSHTENTLSLYVECGSGTYVRSLAVDLGEKLGCGAHLSALRRLWVEPFREPAMVTLDELREAAEQGSEAADGLILPLSAGVADLPALHLGAAAGQAVSQGRQIDWPIGHPRAYSAAFDHDGRLLALVDCDEQGRIRILRGFNLPAAI
ncbi:tRNA pseudouridine(55) synthase TruB [Dyella nitratireducens]|uniref:tRNA pseudouridine synthase B n=1 Tax=Dyella nitratireducens TaxID=1849580 RepID=A0ABQ1FLF4_9GAMM|nr:tRNA pseudouridine(55) synthase TruB [Dyella nitratireducens]GGA17944.1 tRNA pseudouridine synthase B [Dyella nitratireducens]GLQ44721.1 tRNA pseudouridine synthase B [Dyella nitratireducens]